MVTMIVFAVAAVFAKPVLENLLSILNSQSEVQSLVEELKNIESALEAKAVNDKLDKHWVSKVEEHMFLLSDLFDKWEYYNPKNLERFDCLDKLHLLVDLICSCFQSVRDHCELTKEIKYEIKKLPDILNKSIQYTNFVRDRGQPKPPPESTSDKNESVSKDPKKLIGREDDLKWFVDRLTADDGNQKADDGNQLNHVVTPIICIKGVGGTGKTKLAQELFNHPEVKNLFEKAWVSVGETFDTEKVARDILAKYAKSTLSDSDSLDTVLENLEKVVKTKKFLIVLDNVWTEKNNKVADLLNRLVGEKGSRILITTRNAFVTRWGRKEDTKDLNGLTDEQCADILNEIALQSKTGKIRDKLQTIGIEIAKKCYGSPLAAESLGYVLRNCDTEQQWNDVKDGPWDYSNHHHEILKLSYDKLPLQDKRFFLSCVVFPIGSEINLDRLVPIWMAYGCLSSEVSVDDVRRKGTKFFNNVQMISCFFEKLQGDEQDEFQVSYKMHDVIYEFVIHLSGTEYSFIKDESVERETNAFRMATYKKFSKGELGKFRTFCVRHVSNGKWLSDCISGLFTVRVLSVMKCNLKELPGEIKTLIHLRYLDVSGNPIEKLPKDITKLLLLQTLVLEDCDCLTELPKRIDLLINLRHIVNNGTPKLIKFPERLKKLKRLQTLSEIRAASQLPYLKDLDQLRGTMRLFLEGQNASEVACAAAFANKTDLRKLELFLGHDQTAEDFVDALKPIPPQLKLSINQRSQPGSLEISERA